MLQTLFLLGTGYLLGNENARQKLEHTVKSAISYGLSNYRTKGVNNNVVSQKPVTEVAPQPVAPIIHPVF